MDELVYNNEMTTRKNLFYIFVSIDLLLVVLHLLFWQYGAFNLDYEYNLPTYYQGTKAILAGVVLWKNAKLRLFSALSIFLGVDEVLMIHERSEQIFRLIMPNFTAQLLEYVKNLGYKSVSWIILLSPVIASVTYLCHKAVRLLNKNERLIIYTSVLLLAMALGAEIINTQSMITEHLYYLLVAIEEGLELLAISNLFRLVKANVRPR